MSAIWPFLLGLVSRAGFWYCVVAVGCAHLISSAIDSAAEAITAELEEIHDAIEKSDHRLPLP